MSDGLLSLLTHRGDRPRARLLAQGFTEADIAAAVRHGDIVRVARGMYGVPRPGSTPEERHVRLAAAMARRFAGTAVLSHHSALATAGLPLHGVPFDVAHLTSVRSRHYRRRTDHVLHAADFSSQDALVTLQHGASWACPPGLLVELCPGRHDTPGRHDEHSGYDEHSRHDDPSGHDVLPRVGIGAALVQTGLRWGAQALLPSADAALRRGLVSEQELAEAVAGYARSPGMTQVRRAVAAVDPLSESVGETLLRWQMTCLGFPMRSQVEAGCPGRRYRLDLVIEGTGVALEFDGMTKYGLDDAAMSVQQRGALLRAEKSRDENLRRRGWYVIHVTWPELFRPTLLAGRLPVPFPPQPSSHQPLSHTPSPTTPSSTRTSSPRSAPAPPRLTPHLLD
ncbi:hypothetical protein [Austwickia chelonae]|uniref:hypothetical protein n=1 Tax=Austwickia chelonae TaxID=100225 RepID=UPI000E25146E|nr:hypothetical protein [Austwickia chelonae]